MSSELERQQAECRKRVGAAEPEVLLKLFEEIHRFLAQHAITAGMGVHDENPVIEQQYRLTAYAIEQELLRRLSK
jgi:hypothetical protein